MSDIQETSSSVSPAIPETQADTTVSAVSAPQDTAHDDTVVISANTALDGYRLKNFYITNAFQGFVWMIFHFSVVFFFTFQIQSVALVGIFLGIANFIAFLVDIPVGLVQRYYSTKKLFLFSAFLQLIAIGIFFNFIYNVFSIASGVTGVIAPEGIQEGIDWFFGSAINWIGILVASMCYGLAKEINDISTYGYILSNANPKDYVTILARNNITYGLGSLLGLILSWVILSFSPTFAVIALALIIVGFIAFTNRFFDNSNETIEAKDIQSFTVWVKKLNTENVREYMTSTISKVDLPKILAEGKYIFLKPKQKSETKLNWKELAQETKTTGIVIWKIMLHTPPYMVLYWTMSLVLVFGFWDTFASTFLIDFLDEIKPGWSYILLALIAVPAMGLQELMSKLAEKIGIKMVAYIGFALSGLSLIAMGISSLISGPVMFLACAIINSVGYAAGMALGQNQFLENYNRIYAKTMNLKEIDSNASAGPMKILQNMANVFGLVFGWLILGLLGYVGFFIVFWLVILGLLAWSIRHQDEVDV